VLVAHKHIVHPDDPNPNPVDYWMIQNNCEYKNPGDTALTVLIRIMSTNSRTTSADYDVSALLRWVAKAEVTGEETQW
jgi:hypothetical protein